MSQNPPRLLADECVYKATTDFLLDLGYDVITVQSLGLSSTDDDAIIEQAVALSRVFLTRDADFGSILLYPPAQRCLILLVPLGPIPDDLLSGLIEPLAKTFGLPCSIAPSIPTPPTAYDYGRRQYVGHAVLAALATLETPREVERVLGIIDEDCYAPGLNFIFGQAAGRYAFIALPRLRQSFYGLPENEPLFRERVLKEAVHELGHTYGLGHCPDRRCVMHFSNSLRDTDVKGASFCRRCRARLRR